MPDEDYIPEPIGELVIWGQNFVTYLGARTRPSSRRWSS